MAEIDHVLYCRKLHFMCYISVLESRLRV